VGGYGSGRPSHRQLVEASLYVDANLLARNGCLRLGVKSEYRWGTSWINVTGRGTAVQLSYVVHGVPYDVAVAAETVPCRFGGSRVYLRCPGKACGRRVVRLYLSSLPHFLCRTCLRLSYASQREDRNGRMLLKAERLWRKAGEGAFCGFGTFPPKPPRMRWQTYRALKDEAEEAWLQSWRFW
jgi:hypothetical protein